MTAPPAHPRTVVVTNDFPPRSGGIETYVAALLARLDPDRLVVHACAPDGGGPGLREAAEHDARLPFRVVRDPDRTLLPSPALAARVRRTVSAAAAEAVWFPSAAPLGLLGHAVRTAGVRRVVASAHGHEVWWARVPGSRAALRRLGDAVDVVTFDSAVVRRPIATALSLAARARTAQLRPGVDATRFRATERTGWRAPGAPVVLCLSRAVPRKGHGRLLAVWPEVRRRHPGARLLLAGGGPLVPRLRARAAQVPGAEVLGRVPDADLPGLYAAADVFVLPVADRLGGLVTESLGIVLLEAAAAGLPVVAGRAGGTVEAVLDDRTGVLLDARDPAALAAAVVDLLDDPGRAAAMGAAGASWVRRAWDWDVTAQRLAALLSGEPVPRWG
ncbi:glycosyltransferase family 4 protein [Aquipuribacter nitratireducens]|uniref:D-inositol 3-phosphate glycosyltransferase n=1 Tax=Aquipuribacter nitratireducens TaxID=650104 RepID=A0ABW0GRV0_9MICO